MRLKGIIPLTIHGVFDLAVLERDRVNGVVAPSTDATNGQTVTTRADSVTESNVLFTQSVSRPMRRFILSECLPFQSSLPHNRPGYTHWHP
jgi:hypothetical protein